MAFRVLFVLALVALGPLGASQAGAQALSAEETKMFRQAVSLARDEKFTQARKLAAGIRSPLPSKVLQYLDLARAGSGASFEEIAAFIEANPDWPQPQTLQRRAEEAIPPSMPPPKVLEWFADRKPLTVDGMTALGEALYALGQQEKGHRLLRDAWTQGSFGVLQERQFLAKHRRILTEEDHAARLDRLLWDRQIEAAKRMILHVDGHAKQLAQARLSLMSAKGKPEAAFDKVPAQFKNEPGILFERLRKLRAKNETEAAVKLLKALPKDVARPDVWWNERSIIARRAFQMGFVSEAYDIARDHRLKEGVSFAEAEWLAGWIALRFLEDKDIAYRHFKLLADFAQTAHTKARGAYWSGRAAEAVGDKELAATWYRQASRFLTSFYGQLAAAKFEQEGTWLLPPDPLPSPEDVLAFAAHDLTLAVGLLAEAGGIDFVRPFILRLHEIADSPGKRALAANLAVKLDRPEIGVLVSRRAERDGVTLGNAGWPVPEGLPIAKDGKPEKALVLALIRQESGFQHQAVSTAGARGLMQLLPATAKGVAKALGIKISKPQQLTSNPELNTQLGTAYLKHLLDNFGGSYIMALAGYNAGPGRVFKWIREYGDPREADVDAIDWIEMIPFTETRTYVQRVMESTQVYRRRLGTTDAALSLPRDLKRRQGSLQLQNIQFMEEAESMQGMNTSPD
jgi:soluble lytic murein transglycosylase